MIMSDAMSSVGIPGVDTDLIWEEGLTTDGHKTLAGQRFGKDGPP